MKRHTITQAFARRYRDNQTTVGVIEWNDGSRTEGPIKNQHVLALLRRAKRDGKLSPREVW